MPKIITLATRGQKNPVEVNEKNILIVGLNGIGKSYFLGSFCSCDNNSEFKNLYQDCEQFRKEIELVPGLEFCKGDCFSIKKNSEHLGHKLELLNKSFQQCCVSVNEQIDKEIGSNYQSLLDHLTRIFFNKSYKAKKEGESANYENLRKKESDLKRRLEKFLGNKKEIFFEIDEQEKKYFCRVKDLDGKCKLVETVSNSRNQESETTTLSNGERKIFAIISLLHSTDPKFYVWDEPENSLSPMFQKTIINYIREKQPKSTFIIATHSPFILQQALFHTDWIVLKMTRDSNGVDFTEVTSESKDILNLFGLDQELIKFVIKLRGRKVVFVEGKTDVKYLTLALSEYKEKYKILSLDGAGNTKSLVNLASFSFPDFERKWILVSDNDQTAKKFEKTWFKKCINLPKLDKGQAIEAYFSDFLNNQKNKNW